MTNTDVLLNVFSTNDYYIKMFNKAMEDTTSSILDTKELVGINASIETVKTILIVGAGGTSSWFIPKLVKILNDVLHKGFTLHSEMNVILVDGDEVEPKNLIRQNFVESDIGKNKAKVLAERYSRLTPDVNWKYVDKYIYNSMFSKPITEPDKFIDLHDNDEFFKFELSDSGYTLIINLVDNEMARKIIHYHAARLNNDVIDVGNELYNGQLTVSRYGSLHLDSFATSFYGLFPDRLKNNDEVSVYSCADHDTSAEQMFSINDLAATVLGNFITSIFETKKYQYGRYDFVSGIRMSVNADLDSRIYNPYFMKNIEDFIHNIIEKGNNPPIDIFDLVPSMSSNIGMIDASIDEDYSDFYHDFLVKTLTRISELGEKACEKYPDIFFLQSYKYMSRGEVFIFNFADTKDNPEGFSGPLRWQIYSRLEEILFEQD